MELVPELDVLADRKLPPMERQVRFNRELLARGDEGARIALETAARNEDVEQAVMAARFLAGLPGLTDQKNAVIEELLTREMQASAPVATLIQHAKDEIVEQLAEYASAAVPKPGALTIAYELARNFPDLMRERRKMFGARGLFELLLPGAPDHWVATLVKKYRRDANGQWAIWISYVRTDAARDALVTLHQAAPSGRQNFFAALLESAGVFADTREPSTYQPSFRGFVVAPGKSPHLVGGEVEGKVPISPINKLPAERIVEWRQRELPFEVGGQFDPIYFWHEDHHAPGHVYVQVTAEGLKGVMTPMGPAGNAHRLVSVPGSVVLVKDRHSFGIGGAAVKGLGRIQVGGYPQWLVPERFPRCGVCGMSMRFLCSIDSGLTSYARLAFAGILYGFWCESCSVACTYRQL